MANTLYDYGRQLFLTGSINWLTDNIKVTLVDTDHYTVDTATHQFLSSISSPARVATSANLSGKTATAGIADADNTSFTSVVGSRCEAIVVYKDTGDESTSPLIVYIDTSTGLPITPNGADIIINWSNGDNKIFKL